MIISVYSSLFLLHECDILFCFLYHLYFISSICFGFCFTMKAFLRYLVVFVFPLLFKVETPKNDLEALCKWWTCLWWTSLVRKFNGHWLIIRYMQTFYLSSGSISLEGFLFLLPKLGKLGFLDKYSGAVGKGSTELLLREYLSL